MAHEIENIDGRYTFARLEGTDETWHGLGQTIPATSTVDELLDAAGLNYTTGLAPLFAELPGDILAPSVDHSSDLLPNGSRQYQPWRQYEGQDPELLGRPVTQGYSVVPPKLMGEYAQQIIDITSADGNEDDRVATLDCAGSLRGGNRLFITLALDEVTVDRNGFPDVTRTSAVIMSSFDKTAPFVIDTKSIRVVCNNTFSYQVDMIKRELAELGVLEQLTDTRVVLQHRGDMESKIDAGIAAISKAQGWARGYAVLEARLQEIAISEAMFAGIVAQLWPLPQSANAKTERINRERRDHVMGEFRKEAEFRGGATGWAAVNAVTELVSHYQVAGMKPVTVADRPADFVNLRLFGDGKATGDKATLYTTKAIQRVLALA